jgi:hypothetical protein
MGDYLIAGVLLIFIVAVLVLLKGTERRGERGPGE